MKMPINAKAKGFGLIEIMIGIIILAILISGFAMVMINHNNGYQVEYNLTQLQRRGSLGLNNFSRALRIADYRISSTFNKTDIFQDYRNIIPFNAKIVSGTNASVNNNDTITVSYPMSKFNMFSCLAINAPIDSQVQSVLFITENHELACAPFKGKTPNGEQVDIIVEGVEAMRVRFGEDTDHDGIANRYVAADFPGLLMDRVINIKLSLLLRTPEKANLMLDSKYYTLQDVELGPFNDHYVRKVYTTILPMRGMPVAQKSEGSL